MGEKMFNDDQTAHMEFLATLAPEMLCHCKWEHKRDCPASCQHRTKKDDEHG